MARCYTISDSDTGEVLGVVRADRPPSDEAVAAFRELVGVARERMAAEDPDGTRGERQRAAIARVRRRAGLDSFDVPPPVGLPPGPNGELVLPEDYED